MIDEYLFEEIIDGLSAHMQRFLERTAILQHFTAELAEQISGDPDTATRLAEIEAQNLFLVRLDERGVWFRYHHLFAEALRGRLVRHVPAADLQHLHRIASDWFAAYALPSDAFPHAVAAKDWPSAIAFLEDVSKGEFSQFQLRSLIQKIHQLPTAIVLKNQRISYWYI